MSTLFELQSRISGLELDEEGDRDSRADAKEANQYYKDNLDRDFLR